MVGAFFINLKKSSRELPVTPHARGMESRTNGSLSVCGCRYFVSPNSPVETQ